MNARTLLLGDWPTRPIVRDPLDVGRAVLVVGAAGYALAGDGVAAGYLAVSAIITLLARLVELPRVLDAALLAALALTGWGEALGLYDTYPWFDRVVHFLVPMLLAPVIYVALARLELVPDLRDDFGLRRLEALGVLTFALGVAVGGLWEIFEWAADGTFGSNLSENNDDTVGDLIADACGAAAGGGLLVVWAARGWGSVRRIPGENRFEDGSA